MGKRKSKNTAKTGDKAIYKKRGVTIKSREDEESDVDFTYDKVDRYHIKKDEAFDRDFLKLDQNDVSSDEDDGIAKGREEVFNLGLNDDEFQENSNYQEEHENEQAASKDIDQDAELSDELSSTDDSSSENEGEADTENEILKWGGKAAYYQTSGDTKKLERKVARERAKPLGEEELDDAMLEQDAAKEVLQARYANMDEADFFAGDISNRNVEKHENPFSNSPFDYLGASTVSDSQTFKMKELLERKGRNLTERDKLRILSRQSPELLPLLQHAVTNILDDFQKRTLKVTEQLIANPEQAQEVGATPNGIKFIKMKQIMQAAALLNICSYLLLKCENEQKAVEGQDNQDALKSHPVISRLNQFQALMEKCSDNIEKNAGLNQQLDSLVQAAALMAETHQDNDKERFEINVLEAHGSEVNTDKLMSESVVDVEDDDPEDIGDDQDRDQNSSVATSEYEEDEEIDQAKEARFSLRDQDFESSSLRKKDHKSRERRAAPVSSEIGDYECDKKEDGLRRARIGLSSTVNTLMQKQKSNEARKSRASGEGDAFDDDFGKVDHSKTEDGLALMDQMLGHHSSDEENSNKGEDEQDFEMEDDEFYKEIKSRSEAKKDLKKRQKEVAPRYPSLEKEIVGERVAGRMIMKNRGLVPHRNKLQRNPRVKKREQYRKRLTQRKGAVRDIRREEAQGYAGEATGIKATLSRSRKLGVRK